MALSTIPSAAAIDEYADSLGAALVGPRRVKRGMVDEARDHLVDATDAYTDAGYDEHEAAEMAVADFGPVEEIAPAFQTTLAVAESRRTAWVMLAILAAQPFIWDGGIKLAENANAHPPSMALYAFLDAAIEIVGAVMIVGTIAILVLTTIGNRWFRAGKAIARGTAFFTIASCVTLPVFAVSMSLASDQLVPAHVVGALVPFLVAPLSVAAISARRTLAAC
ncbi:permease prefix domain 1-containing protein [Nocardioides speluncae]|uniref:permease prefix domain 1-containing protein n=1 Tax=Nocardioides speluncae TaxID=2670337 RepID=UPI000D68E21B|nr:permease prefix domain 1-containing protein [Nocardioides speluncae]